MKTIFGNACRGRKKVGCGSALILALMLGIPLLVWCCRRCHQAGLCMSSRFFGQGCCE